MHLNSIQPLNLFSDIDIESIFTRPLQAGRQSKTDINFDRIFRPKKEVIEPKTVLNEKDREAIEHNKKFLLQNLNSSARSIFEKDKHMLELYATYAFIPEKQQKMKLKKEKRKLLKK